MWFRSHCRQDKELLYRRGSFECRHLPGLAALILFLPLRPSAGAAAAAVVLPSHHASTKRHYLRLRSSGHQMACRTVEFLTSESMRVHTQGAYTWYSASSEWITTAEALRYMARGLKGFHSFTCTPTRSSASGMSHTCLCLPSSSWYSFTDHGGMEGWVDIGAK